MNTEPELFFVVDVKDVVGLIGGCSAGESYASSCAITATSELLHRLVLVAGELGEHA